MILNKGISRSAKVLVMTSALWLSACGNGDISKLKAQTIAANPSFTIGQAFDHRNACATVSWNQSTDDRGRKVIEYRCVFKVDKSYYEKSQQAEIAQLNKAASYLGWSVKLEPAFVSTQFRGRPDASTAALPEVAYGVRLGAYPAIIAPVTLGKKTEMQETLRLLHSQMVIARSYMARNEVINAHIFLCAVNPSPDADWRAVIDIAERDESVCRKVVWLPDSENLDQSYAEFRARTFLAAPWEDVSERHDAPLDYVQGLAATLLIEAGLQEAVAPAWIDIVDQAGEDLDAMIERLVRARGIP